MEKSLNNKELRKEFKAVRDGIPDNQRNEMSQAITKNVLALLESDFKGANIFLCFYPFGSEVNLLDLYQHLLDEGKSLYFPISDIDNHELSFYLVKDLVDDFNSGAYGIMEPKSSLTKLNLDNISDENSIVVFTPGLIFDENCNRLGYGAGYYDRFFAKYSKLWKIGIGFDKQITTTLNVEAHDVPLDYIVTDNRLIKRGM